MGSRPGLCDSVHSLPLAPGSGVFAMGQALQGALGGLCLMGWVRLPGAACVLWPEGLNHQAQLPF